MYQPELVDDVGSYYRPVLVVAMTAPASGITPGRGGWLLFLVQAYFLQQAGIQTFAARYCAGPEVGMQNRATPDSKWLGFAGAVVVHCLDPELLSDGVGIL
jgi:hypothetical protein